MMYTGKCPHCGNIVRSGHGIPMKRIDTPFQKCYRCGQTYIDENMYEWDILDPLYKFLFYFWANNRWVPYFLFLIILAGGYWVAALVCSIVWAAISYIYVELTKKDDIESSCIRCQNPEYIDALIKNYEKVDMKKCRQYKEEFEYRQAIIAKEEEERAEAARQKYLKEAQSICKKCGNKLTSVEIVCNNCGEKRF